ncbi:MAG: hypothetical protein JXR96_27525 [Deltaproteobacteria bacterium]|nr:hypothetical protein [Deltaproteobacteria bacterium]
MKRYRLLLASGADRSGIVHAVSQYVYQHSCNVEDSRMAVLGGRFAMMMLFSGKDKDVERFETELEDFGRQAGLSAVVSPADCPEEPATAGPVVRMEVVAMDAPGILVQIAAALKELGVSIQSLDAHLAPAPTSGTTISSVKIKLAVPAGVEISKVEDEMERLAAQINLDIVIRPSQE